MEDEKKSFFHLIFTRPHAQKVKNKLKPRCVLVLYIKTGIIRTDIQQVTGSSEWVSFFSFQHSCFFYFFLNRAKVESHITEIKAINVYLDVHTRVRLSIYFS